MLNAQPQFVNGTRCMVTSILNRASHGRKNLMRLPDIANYLMLSVVNICFGPVWLNNLPRRSVWPKQKGKSVAFLMG